MSNHIYSGANNKLSAYEQGDRHTPAVGSTQRVFRDQFNGVALDLTRWTVNEVVPGITYTAGGGVLAVNMGTTNGAETHFISRSTFSLPVRAAVTAMWTQKIAGNQVFFELVSVDRFTSVIDEMNAAAWRLDTNTVSAGVYEVQADGSTRLSSGSVAISSTVAAYGTFEMEPGPVDCDFSSRLTDSVNQRVAQYVRNQQLPDPSANYRLRLRFKNTAVPASATTVNVASVVVHDVSEIVAEISGGRGGAAAGQGIPVNLVTTAGVVATTADNTASGVPFLPGLYRSAALTGTTAARPAAMTMSLGGAVVNKPYAVPDLDWQATLANITTTADTLLKAAATQRNYITAMQIVNQGTMNTEVSIKDGATVIWRGLLVPAEGIKQITFPTPLRGSTATALNVSASVATTLVVNAQGFVSV